MPRVVWLLAVALASGRAQTPTPLENNGKPMQIPMVCSTEDLQTLGLVCSEDDPCPVYVELNAVESVGTHLFIAGNIHTPTATLTSLLLSSSDGAKTWTEPHRRIRFSSLEQIQFIDFANGWISGALSQTLPRDPFFLVTTDGGKTWRERPLFEDTHPGSIESFWFESGKSGTLLLTPDGGKFEMYETMTGGENWTLKQVASKPLTLPQARAAAENGWRLRPNAKTHSYDVEMKEANGWQRISSFLVEIGTCK
jgi:hypothetical protein